MMLVTAIIKPFALENVGAGLERLDVAGMTVTESSGYARRCGGAGDRSGVGYRPHRQDR